MSGLIGKKIGMTSLFDADGSLVGCTVIEAKAMRITVAAMMPQKIAFLRWSAGSDAVQMVDARLAELKAELDAGRALSASVDGEWA